MALYYHRSELSNLAGNIKSVGPPDTPYHNGQYYGVLVFPADYPFKPPAIKMITPSGRFQCNTRLCLSISDFHPKSWNPSWQVSTILTGLVSFMTSEEMTTGGISTPSAARQGYAVDSRKANNANPTFRREFPEIAEQNTKELKQLALLFAQNTSSPATSTNTTMSNRTKDIGNKDGDSGNYRRWVTGAVVIGFIVLLSKLFGEK